MVVCIAGHQSKCAKTTTAVNLAVASALALAREDGKTLLVDWDVMGEATRYFRPESQKERERPPSEHRSARSITPTGQNGLSLLSLQDRLIEYPAEPDEQKRWTEQLKGELHEHFAGFSLVLFDCSHSAGALTEFAFSMAEQILLVVPSDPYFAEFVPPVIQLVRNQIQAGHALDFAGVLITMHTGSNRGQDDPAAAIREFFGDVVFDTMIPFDHEIAIAGTARRSVVQYAPRSRGTRAYIELCMEVLKR
jgi:chromosome partitioning protein